MKNVAQPQDAANRRWLWLIHALVNNKQQEIIMKAEFTAIIEAAPEGGFWAICPEVPGANGQGETIEETKTSLRQAIELILEDRKADILRGLPEDAILDKVMIG
jgi:predicted RNase H-like HicB family nuclease